MIIMSKKDKLSAVQEELESEKENLKKLQAEQKGLHNLIKLVNKKFTSKQKKTIDLLEEEREPVNDLQQRQHFHHIVQWISNFTWTCFFVSPSHHIIECEAVPRLS
jgi:hypothetical protein